MNVNYPRPARIKLFARVRRPADQSGCKNIISKEFTKVLKRFSGFMNLNMKITRSRGETGKEETETHERELIANEIIKNSDSFQRCNNSNYDPAALLSPTSVFGGNVYGRA